MSNFYKALNEEKAQISNKELIDKILEELNGLLQGQEPRRKDGIQLAIDMVKAVARLKGIK